MNKRALKIAAVVLAALLALYAAAGFWLLPRLVHRYVPTVEGRLGTSLRVGEIRFNPFLLTFEAKDLVVEGREGEPMLRVGRVVADAAWSGLVTGTWLLDDVLLDGVSAQLVMRGDGTSNLSDVARHWSSTAAAGGQAPAVLVRTLRMPGARVAVAAPAAAGAGGGVELRPIDLQASNLGNVQSERPASYSLSAAFAHGASLQSRGELRLVPSVQASGRFELRQFQMHEALAFLQDTLQLSRAQGLLDLSGAYVHGPQQPLRLSDVAITASDVSLARAAEPRPMLQVRQLVAREASLDLGARAARMGMLSLEQGQLAVEVLPDGAVDWARIVTSGHEEGAGAVQPRQDSAAPWTLALDKLRLRQLGVAYTDRSGAPLSFEADGVSGELRLALATGRPRTRLVIDDAAAQWQAARLRMAGSPVPQVDLGRVGVQGLRVDVAERAVDAQSVTVTDGHVSVVAQHATAPRDAAGPARDPWSVRIETVRVASLGGRYAARAEGTEPLLVVGGIDAQLSLAMTLGGPAAQVLASAIDAAAHDAVLSGAVAGLRVLRLASLKVSGGRFDLAGRQVGAAKLVATGQAALVREPVAAGPAPRAVGSDSAAATAVETGEGGWTYAIDHVEVPSLEVRLTDRSESPHIELAGTLRASASEVASGSRLSFDATLAMAAGGSLGAKGTARLDPVQVRAKLRAEELALVPLQPMLERFATLELASGALSGAADLSYDAQAASLRVEGQVGITDLLLKESRSGDPFLAWKRLQASGVSMDLGPGAQAVSVREVAVQAPRAKIVISEDREVNLVRVLKARDDRAEAGGAPTERRGALAFDIERLVMRDGEVDFTDQSLVLPFSTTVTALGGTLAGISSDPARHAVVEATGRIEPYGSARVEGSLVPTEPTRFTNLQVAFNNVPVPPLSPYTATFAGRKVQSGRLWLELQYRIEQGDLLGTNQIRLQDFRLGERVQAPNALDIPLDLVVALLADSSGSIRFSVPVTGEVGSAKFSVASAVRQAIGNVLRRTASAPFRAIASLFKGSADSLGGIEFSPGSAELRPEQVEKLDALARALGDRPQLQVRIDAPYDPGLDARAIQREGVLRALAQALGRSLGARQSPGPVPLDDPEVQRALEEMVRSVAGPNAVQALEGEVGRGRKLYAAMIDRLAAAQALPDTAAQVLAADRARTIADYLQRQGVDASRVRTGRLSSSRSETGEVSADLQLAAAGG